MCRTARDYHHSYANEYRNPFTGRRLGPCIIGAASLSQPGLPIPARLDPQRLLVRTRLSHHP